LPRRDRDWILFTDEQPTVPVYPGLSPEATRAAVARGAPPDYRGNFSSARRQLLHSFATTQSAAMRRRASQYLVSADCPGCAGKRLRRESLAVTFGGSDIAEVSRLPLAELVGLFAPYADGSAADLAALAVAHPEKVVVTRRIAEDLVGRLRTVLDLGLGYLSLDRGTPTLSPGELQRLRLATQVRSNLFGVAYVLDEPSAGLHPADTEALLSALARLKAAGNSLFVVEHDLDVIRRADWVVDVGPAAGEHGGRVLYSGPPAGLEHITESQTARHLFGRDPSPPRPPRAAAGWLKLVGVTRNNIRGLDVAFPRGVRTAVTGVSGSGKSSLVSQALVELVAAHLGQSTPPEGDDGDDAPIDKPGLVGGRIASGAEGLRRLVPVDQKPIGRTPRSNLATYTGLFDAVRQLFAATELAKARRYGPGRFSFNVAGGRCETCEGEGAIAVELLFLPGVSSPCPACRGGRFNPATLDVTLGGRSVADVLAMTVDAAADFFAGEPQLRRPLAVLREVGLGYLRLGQPATELSGGEAQRVKLATELQRPQHGDTLYVLDEPTTGLHPADVVRLMGQLDRLVDAGNTVIVVEHEMRVVAGSDHVIDIGPGAGAAGGRVVAAGTPAEVARAEGSVTAPYLARYLGGPGA